MKYALCVKLCQHNYSYSTLISLIAEEVGINIAKSINVEGGIFFKINKRDSTFIRKMRVIVLFSAE